jgi:bifunctional DNase/RNase
MQEMVIYGVSFDVVGKQPIVLLKSISGNRFLPIWIGHAEAAAIVAKLQGTQPPRPMTHDLMADLLGELNTRVTRVTVTELRENTFYAQISLEGSTPGGDGGEIRVDSRPSDAIAIALRANAPIFAADRLLEENGIELEQDGEDTEEMVEQFKAFLDSVSPEDFAQDS